MEDVIGRFLEANLRNSFADLMAVITANAPDDKFEDLLQRQLAIMHQLFSLISGKNIPPGETATYIEQGLDLAKEQRKIPIPPTPIWITMANAAMGSVSAAIAAHAHGEEAEDLITRQLSIYHETLTDMGVEFSVTLEQMIAHELKENEQIDQMLRRAKGH